MWRKCICMRLLQRSVRHFNGLAALAAIALGLAGCVPTTPQPKDGNAGTNATAQSPGPNNTKMIPLQLGDQIQVELTGTPTQILPKTMVLSGDGNITLEDLPVPIAALGKTPNELQDIIRSNYVPRIYKSLTVTVTVGTRYFTVSGDINSNTQSKQTYTGYTTVLAAIGAAGGFTDFAARKRVQLTRQDGSIYIIDCKKALKDPKLDLEVLPGDKIFVDKKTAWEALTGQ